MVIDVFVFCFFFVCFFVTPPQTPDFVVRLRPLARRVRRAGGGNQDDTDRHVAAGQACALIAMRRRRL